MVVGARRPAGGSVVCHNDVCIENVVFRDGGAAALLDFDFAAPGRRVWDVAQTARYWCPSPIRNCRRRQPRRARRDRSAAVLRRCLGLDEDERREFVEVLLDAEDVAAVRRGASGRRDRGLRRDVESAAMQRFCHKLAWIESHAGEITDALTDSGTR